MYFDNLIRQSHAESFACSPENPNGSKGGGSRGKPWEKLHPFIILKPGEVRTIVEMDGPAVLQSMWFGGYNGNHIILRIYWENNQSPSVECPLSAFFAYGYDNNKQDVFGNFPTLNSAMVLTTPCRGNNCYWQMPFLTHCKITLENRSPFQFESYYMITGKKCDLPQDIVYFHASYRQERPVTLNQEYVIIDNIKGSGHYVGTALFAGTNGNNGCWVEGEAKMFIDGDEYPTINYTGLEDYFCGSFAFGRDAETGHYQPFSGQYAGMYAVIGNDLDGYNGQPRFMCYRWHIPDPIFFQKDFKMTLQNLGNFSTGQRCRRDDFASVAYWYQTLPFVPLAPLPSPEEIDTQ